MRFISFSWRFIIFGTIALATGGWASLVSAQGLPISTSYGGSRMQSPDLDDTDGTQNATAAGPRALSPTHGDDRYRAILARLEAQERELRDLRKRLGQSAGPASLVSQPDPASGYGPAVPPGAPPMPPPPSLADVAPADQGPSLDERVGKLEKLTAPKTPLIRLARIIHGPVAGFARSLAVDASYA
ncbi:MAG TPA: hypothetical protein VND64_36980 [Pirellulales bacterium]|nr:hypothetical protein [Pirellulales bacterium]